MSIHEQLLTIIDDPEKVALIIKLTNRQTPMQKYMLSEKGKISKKKSNLIYSSKPKYADPEAAKHFLQSTTTAQYLSLSDLFGMYKLTSKKCVLMQEFKLQLHELGVPIALSYISDSKRVHRKVYDLLNVDKLINI